MSNSETLITQCPHCFTSFKLSPPQLEAAGGIVRCGSCFETFSAAEQRIPDGEVAATPPEDLKAHLRSGLDDLEGEDRLDAIDSQTLHAFQGEPITLTPASGPLSSRLRTAAYAIINAALILALGVQFAWSNIESVVADPRLQPLAGVLCRAFDCPDTSRIDLSSLYVDELSVQSHPDLPRALQVDFVFRNDADRAQPLPDAELNFSDLNQRLVAGRVFTPEEYLPDTMQSVAEIPANSTVQVRLEIIDPGERAVNYSMALRAP